jgi:hypothetical protein
VSGESLFEKIKHKIKPKAKVPCAKTPGNLAIYVLRTDTQKPIANARVSARGPTPGTAPTDGEGWVVFRDRAPGAYQTEVTLPPLLSKFHLQNAAQSGAVAPDGTAILQFEASPPPVLKVKVISRRPKGDKIVEEVLSDVQIEARGPAQYTAKTTKDWSTFRDVVPGAYRITVTSLGARAPEYLMPDGGAAALALGETKEVILVATPIASLRVVLFDKQERPIKGASWALDGPITASGNTAADGLIKVEKVPLSRGAGKLKVTFPKPWVAAKPSPAAPAPDPNAVPPYPPKIDITHFKDQDPTPKGSDADPNSVDWTLKVGLLDDYNDDGGIKDRLGNLGFACSRTSDATATTRAVKAYQRLHLKQPDGSGVLADVKGHVKTRHDDP